MFYNYRMFRAVPRFFAVIAMSLAFFIFPLFFLPGELLAQPRIVFEKEALNFGKAVSGTEVQGKFIVTNKGDQPLEIEGLRPG
ncbi:MAG: hypothetical protein M0Z61_12030 [Nitrospiraceae bacterium]|nr:hypothetical protein [Nitrospiraceae bacterium]